MGPRVRGDDSSMTGRNHEEEHPMKKSFFRGTWQQKRAFSPAVVTEGAGRTIWIAGHTGAVRMTRANRWPAISTPSSSRPSATSRRRWPKSAQNSSDMVTMTVFLIDARHTTRMTELRGELFGKDFPASAAITVQGFAQPEMMIEVQGIAVTG